MEIFHESLTICVQTMSVYIERYHSIIQ